jgi:hypothetical protein
MALADYWNGKKGSIFFHCTGILVNRERGVKDSVWNWTWQGDISNLLTTRFCFVNRELDGVVLKFKWLTKKNVNVHDC